MSIQVGHQLDPAQRPHRMQIAVQATKLVLADPRRPELGWKLVPRHV